MRRKVIALDACEQNYAARWDTLPPVTERVADARPKSDGRTTIQPYSLPTNKPAISKELTGTGDPPGDKPIQSLREIPEIIADTESLVARHLRFNVRGIEKDVVLLGETHLATRKESEAAAKIIPHFSCTGYEGIDVKVVPIEGKVFAWFMALALVPAYMLASFARRSGNNISAINQARSEFFLSVKPSHKIKRIKLEKGWKPGIRTRIFFAAFPVLTGYTVYSCIADTVSHGLKGFLSYAVPLLAISCLRRTPGTKKVLNWILRDMILGYLFDLMHSRDKNMAKNAAKAISNKKVRDMIIVTGLGHTHGIAKILVKEYGATEGNFR